MKWFSTYIHTKFLSVTELTLNIEAWHSSKQYQLRVNQLHSRSKTDGFILFREKIALFRKSYETKKKHSAGKLQSPCLLKHK
jgi:hypothetical protein